MTAVAKGRYLRISPLKLRKVIKSVKTLNVKDALAALKLLPNKGAAMTYKVLHSARANYKDRFPELDINSLVIESIFVDQGPTLRRMLPRARGRADILRKPYSHLTVKVGIPAEKAAE